MRWLEELSQFHMTVLHRPGIKHGNADGLSRIPDEYDFCDCYRAGSELSTLPCGGVGTAAEHSSSGLVLMRTLIM